MNSKELRASLILLAAAAIWGLAFVAQREGARYLGAFSFNGIRFALGALSLLPLLAYFSRKRKVSAQVVAPWPSTLIAGSVAGVILFVAASLQQLGMDETNAGKAAFITGFYILLVPLAGIFLRHKTHLGVWLGVAAALVGLYLLTISDSFTISRGDALELAGAFFWAAHILVIDRFTQKHDSLRLSVVQFSVCSILCLVVAVATEAITWQAVQAALIPLLYGGVCSVGIAYTLQVVGQKNAKPSHSALILSLETVFATLGGWVILGETLGLRTGIGCALMLTGIFVSQIPIGLSRRGKEK